VKIDPSAPFPGRFIPTVDHETACTVSQPAKLSQLKEQTKKPSLPKHILPLGLKVFHAVRSLYQVQN
jgi:hypothetical protein